MKWAENGVNSKEVGGSSVAGKDKDTQKIPNQNVSKGETYEFEGTWHIDEVNLIDLEKLVREVGVKGEYTI